MNLGIFRKYKSWLISAGITVAISLWLLSGQFAGGDDETETTQDVTAQTDVRTSVRVRSINDALETAAAGGDVERFRSLMERAASQNEDVVLTDRTIQWALDAGLGDLINGE